jgi:hypothetical protein
MLVSVATSVSRGRPQTICTIAFEDKRPGRARFFPALTAGWQLDTIIGSSSSALRDEMYSVHDAHGADMTLQMSSTHDGDVVSTTLLETK